MPRQALAAMKRRRTQPEERLLQLVEDGVGTIAEAAHELDMTKGAVSKIKKKLQAKGLLVEGRKLVFPEGAR